MKDLTIPASHHPLTLTEAKKVLGTTAKGLSDEAIMRIVAQVDVLTDIVVAHANDSKIQTSIDISDVRIHTNG
jgi:hypothetical protein